MVPLSKNSILNRKKSVPNPKKINDWNETPPFVHKGY